MVHERPDSRPPGCKSGEGFPAQRCVALPPTVEKNASAGDDQVVEYIADIESPPCWKLTDPFDWKPVLVQVFSKPGGTTGVRVISSAPNKVEVQSDTHGLSANGPPPLCKRLSLRLG